MRYQAKPGWCGAAAAANALRCLGTKVRQDVIARHAGTTVADGTTEHGLRQAIERMGHATAEIRERKYATALAQLQAHLRTGPALLLVEGGGHWVTAIGTAPGGRVVVFDPQLAPWNKAECGVHVLGGDALRRAWDACEGVRYAILVYPGE